MQTKTIFILLAFIAHSCSAENTPAVYQEMDRQLLSLWKSAKTENYKMCIAYLNKVEHEWNTILPKVKDLAVSNIDTEEFAKDVQLEIASMHISLKRKTCKRIEVSCLELLQSFSNLRESAGVEGYPIDDLLSINTYYNDIHYAVHDKMMGLLYWFEFQDLVDNFIDKWHAYDCIPPSEIQNQFDNINLSQHADLKVKLNSCLDEFIDSLESGYTPDFEIPCDDLGVAIRELMWLYAESKQTEI